MRNPKRNDNMIIYAFCVILGGLVRIAYCWKYPVPVRDAFVYECFINEWITTGAIPEPQDYPPISLFLVKVSSELFGYQIIKTGVIINVLLGLGIIIVMMRIAKTICSQTIVVLFAGIYAATQHALVQYSCHLMRENSYLILCCLSILCFLKYYKTRKATIIIICAAFVALSCLCRHEAIEMLLFFCGSIILTKHINRMERLKLLFLLLFSTSLFFCLTVKSLGLSNDFYRNYYDKILSEKMINIFDSF